MAKKKGSAVAREVSSLVVGPRAEVEKDQKAIYAPPTYSDTPSRVERRASAHAAIKEHPNYAKSLVGKANNGPSPSKSVCHSFSPTVRCFTPRASLTGYYDHRQFESTTAVPSLSPTAGSFTLGTHLRPPPKLYPLLSISQAPPATTISKEAAIAASHALWWAHISNSLASLSTRSYHLFTASTFLTCKVEELDLLKALRKLNTDGKQIFEEVVGVLKAKALKWDCEGIDELRICWDMMAKVEMVGRYDDFVREAVRRLEREIRNEVKEQREGSWDNFTDGSDQIRDCAIEDSSEGNSPLDPSRSDWADEVNMAQDHNDFTIEDSPIEGAPPDVSPLNWADEVNASCQDACQTAANSSEGNECSAISDSLAWDSPTSEPLIDVSALTWAEVAAQRKIRSWGAVSSTSWDWERNWR